MLVNFFLSYYTVDHFRIIGVGLKLAFNRGSNTINSNLIFPG